MRQPTAHVVHVDSTCSRSHGRARKRYGDAVSAPTGQSWTVLPLKYEVKGSSGNVSTCVSLPRSTNEMRGSPASSSAKRVHRAQSTHRSRSRCTSELMEMGLA